MNTKEVMMTIIGLVKVCKQAIKFDREEEKKKKKKTIGLIFKCMHMSAFTRHVSNGFF